MKVSIDARYAGIRPSGIGRYTEALLARLPTLAPGVAFEAWLHPSAAVDAPSSLRRRSVASRANHLPSLLWPARLAPLDESDVFHAPFNILGRAIPCATVVTVHDLMWLEAPELCQPRRLRRAVQRWFFGAGLAGALAADRIITPSRASAAAIVARDPTAARRLEVVPHGVEAQFRPPDDAAAARARCEALGLDRPFFLAVGQNAPYKNHDAIVEAYLASGLAPRVALAVVERLSPRPSAASGLVRFPSLDEADLLALLQSALALVQFSRFEGFGLPVVEAMACGTATVVSDIAPLREIAGGASLVVPLCRGELSRALRALAGEARLRSDLVARGRERARAFDWDASARAHLSVYREAISARLRHGAVARGGRRSARRAR